MGVLLVDDSKPVRQMLRRLFSALPQFKVLGEAKDGCQALAAVHQLRPELVILDIRLPRMNGFQVMQGLKDQGSACKVIVFSQHGEEVYRAKSIELGAEAFFDKVADFDAFHSSLKDWK